MKDATESALLIILHGSPRMESDHPARKLVKLLQTQGKFRAVMIGYLECQEPSIPEAVVRLANLGITRLVVVPYLLHSGRHLVFDIPALVREGATAFPALEILMGKAAGQSQYVADAMVNRAFQALNEGDLSLYSLA